LENIILICGSSWSGKWTVAKYLKEKYGACIYRFSDPLHSILDELDIENTRENLANISRILRGNFWENILGVGARNFVEKHRDTLLVLEWVRRIESLEWWRDTIAHIIWIDASPDTRYARMLDRWEKAWEHEISREIFEEQERLETEQSLEGLRSIADTVIENNGTETELFEKIDATLRIHS
jgi:dephospho-CoA kinase